MQQGDPLSRLLFTLANIPGIDWSGWFYDDGTLHGFLEALHHAYGVAQQLFSAINIQVDTVKSKLWVSEKLTMAVYIWAHFWHTNSRVSLSYHLAYHLNSYQNCSKSLWNSEKKQ